jgi:hypothetical protein
MQLKQIPAPDESKGEFLTERVTQGNISFGFILARGEAMKTVLVQYTGDSEPAYYEVIR